MQLISVNIGQPRAIARAKASGMTGIYKRPVSEPVRITYQGITDDAICDVENHGGVDQAIYVYGTDDYAWWSGTLGHELEPGTFGENLTISGLESADYSIGDRLHIADVTLEVTSPRIPCVTLARRMEDPAFAKRFRQAERPGLYCRVLAEGLVRVGDLVAYERYDGPTISAIEMFRDAFEPDVSEATLSRYLGAPIAVRDRLAKEAQLRKLVEQQ